MTGETSDERELRARARREGGELYRAEGIAAVELLTRKTYDPEASTDDRRRYRLSCLEVERLHRLRISGGRGGSVPGWQPPRFSLAGLARLFRFGRR